MLGVLLRKTKSFLRLPGSAKALFAEAVFTSAYVKATLLLLPFKKVAGWLGTSGQGSRSFSFTAANDPGWPDQVCHQNM